MSLKNLRNKRGNTELLAFFIVVTVSVLIVHNVFPGITSSLGNSMINIGKGYNSTDTVILD